MTEETQIDVGGTPDPAVIAAADSSPAETESSSAESTDGVVNAEEVEAVESQEEVDPLKDVPTLEELEKQAGEKVPYAQALANLRTAYEGVKPQLETFEPWKQVVETVGDPLQAQTAYDIIGLLRSPVEGQPNEFTTKPGIERLDQERPGTANQLFNDLLTYEVPDEKGVVDTLVRHQFRSYGLDPDRINDYRNIDTLRASGVVTAEDLNRIPEQYRDAFKSLSQDGQDDILELIKARDSDPATNASFGLRAEEHLRNASAALEAKTWREKDEQAKKDNAENAQREFEQGVQQAVYQDVLTEVKGIHDSIHQNLSSQFTFSSDATVNSLEYGKIMGVLATLQNPAYRFVAENALKSVGVVLNGFDELANRWEQERGKYISFKASGQENTWDGREALSKATVAKQQLLAKLNDYALRLAKASGERAQQNAAQQEGQLGAASARFVPSGAGQVQSGNQNPYSQNPHPVGSQEYYAFNRKVDKEYGLTNASAYG